MSKRHFCDVYSGQMVNEKEDSSLRAFLFLFAVKSDRIHSVKIEKEEERMRKAVFFDIDGTLWNEKMQIPKSTIEAIRTLRQAGNLAFICSGRSRANIQTKELLDIGFDGVVAACGTHIDFHGDKVYEQLLTQEQVMHALRVLEMHNMRAVLEGPEYIYVEEDAFLEDPYVIHLREELGEHVQDIAAGMTYEINKLSTTLNGADLERVAADFGEDFAIINHGGGLVEIQPNGHSKATGVARVCELFKIDRADTYAFGDSANDLEMLSYVAHGIAMGNGTKEAKQAAEYVTADIMEDGIMLGLRHYGLI